MIFIQVGVFRFLDLTCSLGSTRYHWNQSLVKTWFNTLWKKVSEIMREKNLQLLSENLWLCNKQYFIQCCRWITWCHLLWNINPFKLFSKVIHINLFFFSILLLNKALISIQWSAYCLDTIIYQCFIPWFVSSSG